MKSVKSNWKGHVKGMGNARVAYKILRQNLKEIDHLENLGIDGG
jgi:hypothetical protein